MIEPLALGNCHFGHSALGAALWPCAFSANQIAIEAWCDGIYLRYWSYCCLGASPIKFFNLICYYQRHILPIPVIRNSLP
jgi:hypothetical protein